MTEMLTRGLTRTEIADKLGLTSALRRGARLIGLLATSAYNTGGALTCLHALIPLPPLIWAADKANNAGDALEARAQRSEDYR